MARATWVQTNFNAGEWTPLAWGRFDLAKFRNGMAKLLNYMPTQQGGLTRRPGFRYAGAVKDSSYAPRLVKFEFSVTQAYVLEFGHHYVRVFADGGPLYGPIVDLPTYVSTETYQTGDVVRIMGIAYRSLQDSNLSHAPASSPTWWAEDPSYTIDGVACIFIEVTTPYSSSEIWDLNFAQSADTLYIAHPSHTPRKLQRRSSSDWRMREVSFLDGPYLSTNVTATTLTPSGTSGSVTVTASSLKGINNGGGFTSYDIGRMLRIKCGGVWLWGRISAVADYYHCTWDIAAPSGSQLPVTATGLANVSSGSVFSVSVTDGGSGYGVQPPSVSFVPKPTVSATAHLTVVAGVITAVTLDTGGSGYSSDPVVSISSAGGSGAIIYAHVSGGSVIALYLAKGGTGYSGSDAVNFSGGGAAAGSGAVAYATVTNGVVTSVTMSVTGTGYTAAPDVVMSAPTALTPSTTTFWRLGLWDLVDGYPACVAFHQDRLCWAGAPNSPGRVDGSNSGDYENMAPTNLDGTVVDSNALAFTLNSGTVNAVRWMVSDEWGLLIGTAGAEWVIAPSNTQQAITPTNVNAKQLSGFGSSTTVPIRVGKATLFVQRTKRKLRELFYQFTYNTFQAVDISLVGEHLTKSGLRQLAVQLAPQQIVWISCINGKLTGMTYDKDQEICGWHGHTVGGYSDAGKTLPPLVESVVSIPSTGIERDEVWVVVNRYINGAVRRTIEVSAKLWEDGDDTAHCVFLDSSAEYDGVATTTISGLTWLVGETVGVLADGSVHPDRVVSAAGTITLQRSATVVQVGLKYTSLARTLSLEAGGADGPAQGKLKRVFKAVVRFFQSVGLSMGSSVDGVTAYPEAFRTSADPMSGPVGLFDGDKRWNYDGTWETAGQIYFETSDPLPSNITMLMAQVDTQDAL